MVDIQRIKTLQNELKITNEDHKNIQLGKILSQTIRSEFSKLTTCPNHTEMQKSLTARQQFAQQLHENELVINELNLLDEGATVYKLIGPALVKQDHEEATSNVNKRLDFIKGEIKRIEDRLTGYTEQANAKKNKLMKLQEEAMRIQQQQQAALE
jgi:prefoldin beta subunit